METKKRRKEKKNKEVAKPYLSLTGLRNWPTDLLTIRMLNADDYNKWPSISNVHSSIFATSFQTVDSGAI